MPVDQTGESIVFWIDDDGAEPHTEAHIQIQYEGDAERFAWIIPVTSAPEVLVGSQALFNSLAQATVPVFTTQSTTIGDCSFGSVGFCMAKSGGPARGNVALGADNEGAGLSGGGSESQSTGPEILDRGFAGAFEYVTLTGETVTEVTDWLDEAGYAQDPEAEPILAEYLDEGFVFVAVKLRSGAEVQEIHPLAIRYAGTEPCIPIRLTRIAAVDDMAIRALFLGQRRVVPQNWAHVEVNHARYDWANGPAASYAEVVGLAIDEAGGRGFVTEYAGTSATVSTANFVDAAWDPAAYAEIEAIDVVDTLTAQGLMSCVETTGQCSYGHPQVQALLDAYLPVPGNLSAYDFYSCLQCHEGVIDPLAWSAEGFSEDFEDRISGPGQHAVEMLADAEYLTRLFTLLSPHEMIEDPLFHEAEMLGTVDRNIVATRVTDCDGGPTYFELADGRRVALDEAQQMPPLDDMPAAARIERIPMVGPAQVELDNGEDIDALLDVWNESRITGPSPGCAIGRVSLEGVLSLASIFGIAWFSRGRRRRRELG